MATSIYDSDFIELIDGTQIYITPLKIKYLRKFMEEFESVKTASGDSEAISHLSRCALIAMQQYRPEIKTVEELEDLVSLPTVYKILDIAAGIKINDSSDEGVKEQAVDSGSSWESFDIASLESELFLLGIWKDYEELESSLSMPEIVVTLNSKRDLDYQEKKFFAAIQGVDLDKQTGKADSNAWEKLKAKVFSGGETSDPNDITSLQGYSAQKAGFGIGMGLSYEDHTKKQ